jgi:WD40 repeat protein
MMIDCRHYAREDNLCGHGSRIFCVKFNKTDENIIASGGWDNNIFLYDIRVKGPITAIYGPLVYGEAIEFHSDGVFMVTGSYRNDEYTEVRVFIKFAFLI